MLSEGRKYTLAELTNVLQNLCHEGHSNKEVVIASDEYISIYCLDRIYIVSSDEGGF